MSVHKRVGTTGTTWQAIVDAPRDPGTGQRRQIKKTFGTKREAEAWERRTRAAIDAGDYHEPSAEPFGGFLDHWLATADLAPNTHKAYAGVVRRLIVPALGAVPLGKLTGRQVQALYNEVRDSTYAVQVQAVVSGALKQAVREGTLRRNVADGLIVGRTERREPSAPPVWTPEQLRVFLDDVQGHWLHPLFWVAAHTGLRLSELIALRWDDLSLDLGRLFVGASKTAAGRRRLALDATTVARLREHRADQARRRDALGDTWVDLGVVFDRGNGEPVAARTVQAMMTRRVARLGLPPLTPHGLRHTHATLLLLAGTPVHLVQQRLGHASANVTLNVYAHALPVSERDVAECFAGVLAGSACDQNVTKPPKQGAFSASA